MSNKQSDNGSRQPNQVLFFRQATTFNWTKVFSLDNQFSLKNNDDLVINGGGVAESIEIVMLLV